MIPRAEILAFWNWLPAFRAVAETEHLPTAAENAHVTPAALSRTVRLLEDQLGRELFNRQGRGLQLNYEGEVLLRAVRRAMRVIHEAKREIEDARLKGEVRVAAGGVGRIHALRAVAALRAEHPGARPWFLTPDVGRVIEQLLIGELDLAIGSFVLRAPGLTTELLGYATSAVYCGPSHPLHGRERVGLEEVQGHGFCAPPSAAGGAPMDGWPPEIARDIAFYADRMETGLSVGLATDLLVVLPDALVRDAGAPLWRIGLDDLIPASPVVVLSREPTGSRDLPQRLLELLRQGFDSTAVPSR